METVWNIFEQTKIVDKDGMTHFVLSNANIAYQVEDFASEEEASNFVQDTWGHGVYFFLPKRIYKKKKENVLQS